MTYTERDLEAARLIWEMAHSHHTVAENNQVVVNFNLEKAAHHLAKHVQAEIAKVNEWLPIETAPKDGSDVLIATVWGDIHVGYFDGRDECWMESQYVAINETTHWRPLPAPPGQDNQGSGE